MSQLYARCHGVHPEGPLCPLRRSCLHHTAEDGDLFLSPRVDKSHRCYDYLPELGQQMAKGMMEEQ